MRETGCNCPEKNLVEGGLGKASTWRGWMMMNKQLGGAQLKLDGKTLVIRQSS